MSKKGPREKFIELFYIVLYSMVISSNKESVVVIDYYDKIVGILNTKKNIEISKNAINTSVDSANEKLKSTKKDEGVIKVFENIQNIYNTWKNYIEVNEKEIEELIQVSGGYDENDEIKNPADKISVKDFVDNNKLQDIKNNIQELINKISQDKLLVNNETISQIIEELNNFAIIKVKEKDNIVEKSDEAFQDKEVIYLLEYLYKNEQNICSYITIILDKLINLTNVNNNTLDNFDLIVIPKKETIVAGKNFEATAFLNVKDYVKIEGEEPTVKVNNTPVKVEDYIAYISYPTDRNMEFDENGNKKIMLRIEYSQKNPFSDKDIVVTKDIVFTVINKNDIEGAISVTNTFYKNCTNKYIIKNGDPELNNNLTYELANNSGRIISVNNKSKSEIELFIYPTTEKCKLLIKNNNIIINSFEFNTIEPPLPSFIFSINDNQIEDNQELNSSDIQEAAIETYYDDQTFEMNYPLDSTNVVKNWVIELKDQHKKTYEVITVINKNKHEFSDSERKLIMDPKCNYIYIRALNISRQHRDNQNNDNLEEIPLFESNEILAKQIKVVHKKNTRNIRK